MNDTNDTVLDLDEMLGEKQTVKVRRDGREYELRDINSFSAYQLLTLQNTRRKAADLQSQTEPSEEQAKEVEALFDRILEMLCPDFSDMKLAYAEKPVIIAFYFMEVRKKKAKTVE